MSHGQVHIYHIDNIYSYYLVNILGRNSGTELTQPSFLSHQMSNIFHDPKLSPIQKRSSATPSPTVSNSKELTVLGLDAGNLYDTGVQEITEIPDDYLNESSVLKHLAKEVKVPSPNGTVKDNIDNLSQKYDTHLDFMNRPPPPEYPKWTTKLPLNARNKMNIEKANLSKSQPDLSKIGVLGGDIITLKNVSSSPRPKTKGREVDTKSENVWSTNELIETLIKENSALKIELDTMYQKASKAHKVMNGFYCSTITFF